MEMFDKLENDGNFLIYIGIVKKGYITKMFSDYHDGIEICDKLRECLLIEES